MINKNTSVKDTSVKYKVKSEDIKERIDALINKETSKDTSINDTSINDTNIKDTSVKDTSVKEIESLKETIKQLRSDSLSYLYSALAKAQAELPIVQKANKSFANQMFASLADMVKFSRPILTKHGLSVTQLFEAAEGSNILVTRLCHSSGQFVESRLRLVIADSALKLGTLDICKEYGKSISYLGRYAYMCLVGIATDDIY